MTKADVHYRPKDIGGAQVLIRCRRAIRDKGIDLNFIADRAPDKRGRDVLICHHSYAVPALLDATDRPVVVLERSDAAGLSELLGRSGAVRPGF